MTKQKARIIGLVYLLFFLASILSEACLKGLVVKNDSAATVIRPSPMPITACTPTIAGRATLSGEVSETASSRLVSVAATS